MAPSQLEAKGLFAGLFDVSFTTFITLKFLRVIYIVLMVLILLAGLTFLLRGLTQGGGTAVAAIVLVPVFMLLYLVFARISMELIALFFRIGENTSIIAVHLAGGGTAGGTPPAPGGIPPGGYPPPGGHGYGMSPQA